MGHPKLFIDSGFAGRLGFLSVIATSTHAGASEARIGYQRDATRRHDIGRSTPLSGGAAMRRFVLLALLPFLVAIPRPVIAQVLELDESSDGLLPPGVAELLARDRGVPAATEGPVPYVIVTSRALRPEFMGLARARIRGGITSVVRSLEGLRSDYPVALDDPDRIRQFLRDAHQRWGTRWVLLGGDVEVIPPRYATLRGILPEREIVSDWYYACLDGTWDADGDGRYGELPIPPESGDAADLEPELFLGRAPVSNRAEAGRFVDKTLAYARRPADGFENTTLLFAHTFEFGPLPGIDFAEAAEIMLPRITDDPAQQVTRHYQSYDNPAWVPGALPESRESVIAALDQGHNVVVGFGVGSEVLLGVGTQEPPDPQLLTVSDVLGLTNADRAGHLWLATSLAGAFDSPTSLAEAFLRAPEGGAVTVIAPSDITFLFQMAQFTIRFGEVVFDEGAATIGEALVRARADLIQNPGLAPLAMCYQLLGDPMLRIFPASPVAAARGPDHGRTGITRRELARESEASDVATAIAPAPAPDGIEVRCNRLSLSRPAPSPAWSSVLVECVIPESAGGVLEAEVLDLAGRAVRRLDRPAVANGRTTLTWDLRDEHGRQVRPGVYFLRVQAGAQAGAVRLVVAESP